MCKHVSHIQSVAILISSMVLLAVKLLAMLLVHSFAANGRLTGLNTGSSLDSVAPVNPMESKYDGSFRL